MGEFKVMPISSSNPFEKIIELYTTTCPICEAINSFEISSVKIQPKYENDYRGNTGWFCHECGVILYYITDKYCKLKDNPTSEVEESGN